MNMYIFSTPLKLKPPPLSQGTHHHMAMGLALVMHKNHARPDNELIRRYDMFTTYV